MSNKSRIFFRLFYDDNGNRIAYIANGDTVQGVYDDQDRMLAYGNTEYIYNAQGSLTTKISGTDTTRYCYDLMGNLLTVSLTNGDQIEYIIDPQNRRTGKILNGVVVKKWIYQDQLNPVAELDGAGNLISRFVYGGKGHVPAYMEKAGVTYRIITDHLGSVRAVVNVATGDIVQEISYNEFGVVLQNTDSGFQPFGYCGGLTDNNTKLIKFGARDYSPAIGRWLSKEPLGFSAGQNFYIYAHNNPINLIDFNGLYSLEFDYENQRVFATITEKGETLWELSERLTGDGRNWENITRDGPCPEIDPTTIEIGDQFDITGLFDQGMLDKMFYESSEEGTDKMRSLAGAYGLIHGAGIMKMGVDIALVGAAGSLVAGTCFIVLGGALVLISADLIVTGGENVNEFFK